MSKKSNFILGVIKSLSYLGCLMIILANRGNNLLIDNNELIKPVIYIESLILRFMVITTILTYAGFNLMREVMRFNKIKSGLIDKYLAIVFFILGIYSLFLPTAINKITNYFLLSILLYMSYLTSVKIYKNNEYNKLI